jgi:hypothetical protein
MKDLLALSKPRALDVSKEFRADCRAVERDDRIAKPSYS